ncbi:MAG: flgC [Firmicutes bacterium]|nr:flgC [Bacillota bacterium]
MAFLSSMNIVGSGLTAQQLRLDVISENVVNMNTTRTEGGGPYRRKMVVFESQEQRDAFRMALARSQGKLAAGELQNTGGVRIAEIVEDPSDLKLSYDPDHPDANAEGYVELPNIDLVKEITDAMAATQAYSANVTALNTLKAVTSRALEIGR